MNRVRLATLALASLAPSALFSQTPSDRLHRLFTDYFENQLRETPEMATARGRDEYNAIWRDWSKAGVERRLRDERNFLAQLAQVPTTALSEQDRLSARLLKQQLEQTIEGEPFDTYLLRVFQMYGIHTNIYSTVDLMPTRAVKDYENIIARLNAVPPYVDQNLALLDEAIRRGLVQPRIVSDLVIGQIASQMGQNAEQTPLLAAFRKFPASIPAAEQERLKRAAADTYDRQFLPAWRKLHTYMVDTYAPKSRPNTAVTTIPGGREAYAFMVRRTTTTNLTPEQIHQLGLSEVKRIEAEMEAIKRETGFNGSLAEFDRKVNDSPEQHFHDKDEMLAYCRNVAKIVEPELPRLFKNIPRLLYGIRPIPADREAASASNAQPPAPDGSRPGWFNLNTYNPEKQVRFDKEALVLHEAVPGHILQLSLAQQLDALPEFRKSYRTIAYIEGWGLYAESLGPELGVYRDPYSRFGRLSSERFRAARLVVDTGLHQLGWSRAQAIDYLQTHAPSISLAEIDRYIGWPSQALGYKMGQLKITELRKRAEQELGPKFDIRAFHDVVLRNGPLPLDILDEQVTAYIHSAKGSVPSKLLQ